MSLNNLDSLLERNLRTNLPPNATRRSALIPKAFQRQPGLAQFAYATVANARMNYGEERYLDGFESELTDTLATVQAAGDFTSAAISNLGLYLRANKPSLDSHFNALVDVAGYHSAILMHVTDTRAVWELEHD